MNESKRTNKKFYIFIYTSKYILAIGLIICLLQLFFIINPVLTICLFAAIDFLTLKKIIIEQIENDDDCKLKISELEKPFLLITSLFLIIITILSNFNAINIVSCLLTHNIIFKLLDIKNERRIKKANKEMDVFFKNHPEIKRKDK